MRKEIAEKLYEVLERVLDRDSQYCGTLSSDAREDIQAALSIAAQLVTIEIDSLPTRPWRGPEC